VLDGKAPTSTVETEGAFEHKRIAMLGNAQTIEQTFQGVLGQEKPKILFALAGQVQQSLSNGRWQIVRCSIQAMDSR
jgi:hypothetical protein